MCKVFFAVPRWSFWYYSLFLAAAVVVLLCLWMWKVSGGIKSWDQSPALVDQLGERDGIFWVRSFRAHSETTQTAAKKRISAHFEFFWNILVKNWPSPVASWCLWQAQMIRPSFIWISYTADWIWTSRSVVCTRILHTPLLIWVAVGCLCVSVCLKMFRGGGGKRFDFPPPIYVRDCT